MVTLLANLWIHDKDNISSPKVREAYGVLCGAVGIMFNILLAAGKLFAGLLSGSIAITADAANNFSDAASSLIVLVGFRLAGHKPDKDHPFGHGRVEYISGLLVSMLIIFMAFELFKSSIEKIIHPETPEFAPVVLVILLASVLVKFYMFCYNRGIGKRIHSEAMLATSIDSLSDMVATSVVLASTLVSHYLHFNIDGWCGILVAALIFYAGYCSAKDTISPLLGQAPDSDFVDKVVQLVMAYDDVIGVHDLVVHNYGPGRTMISLHAEVPAEGDILVLHDMIDNIERHLRDELMCTAVIHMDPVVTNDEETIKLKRIVAGKVAEIDEQLSIHDFRVVKGPTHTNVIFDLRIPFGFRLTDDEVLRQIKQRISEYDETYYAVIEIDR